jgi:hypothetical protein
MKILLAILVCCSFVGASLAQVDSTRTAGNYKDTTRMKLNMDAVYNRPFLDTKKSAVAIGGYMEANCNYANVDGISEGLSFQMQRTTIFLSSTLHQKIKFLSELEFEDGTKEINLEFAAIDLQLHPLFTIRGGIVMNPIGSFNQNHDGPKWEFISRPISATQLLPATFSNVGFGIYGKVYRPKFVWAYEAYLTNGFNDHIINNVVNKTYLPATKLDQNRFEESFNGVPLKSLKTTFRLLPLGEFGISYMGGVYNKFETDGLRLDKRRNVDVLAFDFNTTIKRTKTVFNAEFALIEVDVPDNYAQQFGRKQFGGFVDIVQTLISKRILGFEKASILAAIRVEYVDWNAGKFRETGTNISEDIFAIVPSLSFRTSAQTVIRCNYRLEWQQDLLGNPASHIQAIQMGISSYF